MNENPSQAGTPPDEELVAYLDGELDAEHARRIEELLGSNAEVRRRVQDMERTWDLLDGLDAAPADGNFTHTTLELVAVAARHEVDQTMAEAPRVRRRHFWLAVTALLTAVVVGFLAMAVLWPDPNRQLLEDLPVLESLDSYRQVDEIEYLHMLEGLFPVKDADAMTEAGATTDESLAQRRQRIAEMSPSDHEQLERRLERFAALEPDEQRQLRQLAKAMQEAPDGPQLRQVMRRYCEWLKTLPLYTRGELAELKPADRVKAVEKQLNKERNADQAKRLGSKDIEALRKWMNAYVVEHEAQFLRTLSESGRKYLEEMSPADRRHSLFLLMSPRRNAVGTGPLLAMMTDEDMRQLKAALGAEAGRQLDSSPPGRQRQLVAEWIREAIRQRRMRSHPPAANDAKLADFFEKGLSDAERDRLLAMPGDEMPRALQQMYLMRTAPRDKPAHPPEGAARDKAAPGERPAPKKPDEASRRSGNS
jgi:hypothetical protein